MLNRYEATTPDGRVSTRNSKRAYSHAVAVKVSANGIWFARSWCGSAALAEKRASGMASERMYSAVELKAMQRRYGRVKNPLVYVAVQVVEARAADSAEERAAAVLEAGDEYARLRVLADEARDLAVAAFDRWADLQRAL